MNVIIHKVTLVKHTTCHRGEGSVTSSCKLKFDHDLVAMCAQIKVMVVLVMSPKLLVLL